MMMNPSRRRFLTVAGSATALGGASGLVPAFARLALAAETPVPLVVERRTLEVFGKAASVFGIRGPDGKPGLTLDPGRRFLVDLANRGGEDTVIHWHGQTPPHVQDGVADANRPLVKAGASQGYDFAPRTGTHWMHSHHGLQEQLLMAAPLIVHTPDDLRADVQEVTVLLHDFTFRDPAELLAGLTKGAMGADHAGHGGSMPMNGHAGMSMMMSGGGRAGMMPMGGMSDLNDVEYDAYLADDRTIDDPRVVTVERGGRVRLRLINGATSTAFHIDPGSLTGVAVAVDGNPVNPVGGGAFGLAMGQRIDILLSLPVEGGAFPILATREGDKKRAGIILATPGAAVNKLPLEANVVAGPVDPLAERRYRAETPLADRPADVTARVTLTGSMMPYVWSIDGRTFGKHQSLRVKSGQRVVVEMVNASMMAHPMHLHGHHFQVVAINGEAFTGAVRDTVLVPAMHGSVTIAFDADNPGRWPFHCHNLLHMATGMMTEVVYDGFV